MKKIIYFKLLWITSIILNKFIKLGWFKTAEHILNFRTIAKLTKTHESTVSRLIDKALSLKRKRKKATILSRKKLKPEHLKFLLDQQTLEQWAHLSLK